METVSEHCQKRRKRCAFTDLSSFHVLFHLRCVHCLPRPSLARLFRCSGDLRLHRRLRRRWRRLRLSQTKKDSSECASRCGRRFDVLKAFQKDLKDVKRLQNDTKRLSKRTQGLFGTLQSCQEVPLAHVGWPDPCAPGPQSGPKTRMWRRFQRKRTKNTGAAALCRLLGGLRLAGLGRLSPHSSEPWRSPTS